MIDMHQICREIKHDLQPGYHPNTIRINLDSVTPDIHKDERPKIINLFDSIAKERLHQNTTIYEDNSISELYDYDLVCSQCEQKPLFDEQESEYYCASCKNSVFDY